MPQLRPLALALLGAALSACGFGATLSTEGQAGSRCPDCTGDDGGEPAPPVVDGTTVAFLETSAPAIEEFVLRGTFPVPPGTFPRSDGRAPFVVLDYDGTALATQTELVSRYPDERLGADVVEVIARVRRDPAIAPGTRVRYEVLQAPGEALPAPGPPDLSDLTSTQELPSGVRQLLSARAGLEIAAYDCFGNRYVCRPLDGSGDFQRMRRGRVHSELRVYQTMLADPPRTGASGTLPHFLGVHAYLSTFQRHDVLGLDLRFHNGHCGRDVTTPLDDPLDKVYFERIEIALPPGWLLFQDFEDPFFGGTSYESERWVHDLVKPDPGGKLHVLRWQGQFHRRLMISSSADQSAARSYLNGVGQGFCVRGTDPLQGGELWSWWNRGTARYFPQRYQLPRMDHVLGELRSSLAAEHDRLEAHLVQGTGTGDYPVQEAIMGWGHPYGVGYGGMTGGAEIVCWDGVGTAVSASTRGYRLYEATHRMHTDRMPTAFYERDGQPTSVESWLQPGGYVPFYHFLRPFLESSYPDPFGFRSAPRFQIEYVAANGLKPGYEYTHLNFDPHDFQHFIRYTRSAKVLAWLGNDSLAKDDLRMQAENFHLSFHPYRNDPGGGVQTSGLRAMEVFVHSNPGKGCTFGRGEAWGLDCAVAAYALSDPAWRARKRPWFERMAEMLLEAQGSCNGFIQAFVSEKAVGGRYRARQLIEQSITENALQGLRETVFRGIDPGHSDMVRDVMVDSLYAFVGEMSWFPNQGGPWRYTGVGPLSVLQPIWCSRSQMPSDAWTAGDVETYQDWSSFAYGYELTGDPIFFEYALKQLPAATNLLTRLKSEGTENLDNRAPLIALLERLNGEL